jgi:transcriptional regulator of acetoin/glycerol metabolism
LVEIALKSGFDGVAEVLPAAVVAAQDRLEVNDLPQPSSRVLFIDEILETEDPLATLEHRLLTEVLERTEWRTQEAADRLGMSRVTLWRKTRDYGIERPSACEERR